ncbi:GGDEF domain-containing protein [Noviherbaspirillum aridicola]|uniref:diguanylate cyclase n=1 Tax=Noviherbaspirillum aridicola TaxID=2849687 RepID=A0ABQ4Q8B2_9BURK|nr:GGDEF domain-containing protein [Noviherbaspirillum aridicola]GIZ53312.1 GGDEF domain-containing protein [Noviherbaspirillum aridicola]
MAVLYTLLLLVTCALSVVMLLVLFALRRSRTPGVRCWFAANAAATLALPLFAARGVAPDFLSIEVANFFMLGASGFMLAGYRRCFSRPVPLRMLLAGGTATLALVAGFHYILDSLPMRIVAVSAFHGAVCLAIGLTVARVPHSRTRYPFRFAACAAFALAFGHFVRLGVYALQAHGHDGFLDPGLWNLSFLAFGTLALPLLTIGGVMIVYEELVARANELANRDFLTNAWSRRAFFEIAERERNRALRGHPALSLIVFDVDHFKAVNDSQGHEAGDRVLVGIVHQVQSIIRSVDYCARLGGEEFAILLPDADRGQARAIAERIRASVMEASATAGMPGCTVSAGVATWLGKPETMVELLRRADDALYGAKEQGRNRVVSAEEMAPGEPAAAHAAVPQAAVCAHGR